MFSHGALFSFTLTSIRGMKKKNKTVEQLIKISLGLKINPETDSIELSKYTLEGQKILGGDKSAPKK